MQIVSKFQIIIVTLIIQVDPCAKHCAYTLHSSTLILSTNPTMIKELTQGYSWYEYFTVKTVLRSMA